MDIISSGLLRFLQYELIISVYTNQTNLIFAAFHFKESG